MIVPLRVLFVEDNEDDLKLQVRELHRAGYLVTYDRVETEEGFRAALAHDSWHFIFADFAMPRFTGMAALRILNEGGHDIPFILISGTVGEEVAVESMRAGAHDYLLKDNLTRLGPAVTRELRDAEERRRRREAETALRESQAILSLIYDNTSDSLALYTRHEDGSWRLESVNRTYVRRASSVGAVLTEADLLGRTVQDVVANVLRRPAEEAAIVVSRFESASEAGQPLEYEQIVQVRDYTAFIEVTLVPVPGRNGNRRHILGTGRDVTEKRRAEEEQRKLQSHLYQAQKLEALGQLAGGIAHDFNNILTGVIGYTQLIKADTANDAAIQDNIQQILYGTQRARELIRQILTFSRRQAPSRKPIMLDQVIKEALQFLRAGVSPKIALQPNLPAMPPVLADAGQVHQVLMNLCTNAVQALGEGGGRIAIELERFRVDAAFARAHAPLAEGDHVRLAVSDDGPGMDAATLERIFEPFFTTKPPGVGTGLGLAVVHGVAQSHEAAVTVHSQPGVGTTFRIYFPALAMAAPAMPISAGTMPRGQGQHILLVDDEAYLVRLGVSILDRLGYKATSFTHPQHALEAFRADPGQFALVVTDLTMPHMNGQEMAKEMLALRPDLQVILTTGFSGAIDDESAREMGFCQVLSKPFLIETVANALHQALSRADAQRDG